MLFSADRLNALRDCCKDDAAFTRLQHLLGLALEPEDGRSPCTSGEGTTAFASASPMHPSTASNGADHSELLRGIAEANAQLLMSDDYTQAIQQALATLGQRTGADRVYIFEVHPHPTTGEPAASQRFEWVGTGITPQLDNLALQNLTYINSGLERWHETLEAGRPFSAIVNTLPDDERALLVVQDIQSILIVPILIHGELWGVIGFDDCHRDRHWTTSETAALQMVAASLGGAIARQRAESALFESQSHLQKIAANIPGMIYQFLRRVDGTRQVLYASSGCREILGLEPEQLEGGSSLLWELCHPDDRPHFEQSVETSARTGQPWNWEGRIITPSGAVKWIQGFSRPEFQPNGDLLWDGVFVDITERKQIEEERRLSDARYKAMLDASPDLMFRISRDGHYLDCKGNNATGRIPPELIVGRSVHDLLPPAVAALCLETIAKTLATGELQTCEYQLTEAHETRAYEARLVVSGQDEVLWIVQDVTERKQSAAKLRASEERLQRFFEATFEAVIFHNFEHILDVNPAAEALLGYSTNELIGLSTLAIVADESLETVLHLWRSLPSPEQPYAYEAICKRKDGSQFIAAVSSKAIHYSGRMVRVASIRDITERKRSEAAIRQSEARNSALVNAIPDLMFRIHRDGTYLDCKSEDDNSTLVPAPNLLGKTVYDVLPPDLATQRMYYIHQALETGVMQRFEYQLRFANNTQATRLYQRFSPSNSPESGVEAVVRDYEARVVVSGDDEVVAIVRDITERKRSERALQLSEEKFAKTFQASPVPMTLSTVETGRIIEVNDSFLQTSGYQRDQVIGKQTNELNLWANAADRDRMVQTLQQEGRVRNIETLFRMKSGTIITTLFSAELVSIGDQPCILATVIDITERKQAEQKLWEATERDRLLGETALRVRQSLDLTQILQTTVDEVRQLLHADRVFIGQFTDRPTGGIAAESRDPRVPSVSDWEIDAAAYEEMKVVYAGGCLVVNDAQQSPLPPFAQASYRRYHTRASLGVPIILEGRLFGALVAHQCSGPRDWAALDIQLMERLATQVAIAIQQAQLYQQVRDLNEGLEQQVAERTAQLQQKMEELQELNQLKDEFLNAFSHDLRTPVMGISLVMNNLLNQGSETIPVSRSILERMVQSTGHQLNLINSFLQAYSSETRGVILNYELVQLGLLTQVIVEDIEPLVDKNQATLANFVPTDLPLVNADPVQLRRVFENLITNALNHNPPGVNITVNATVEADLIRMTLGDDGVGMAPEVSSRIFERYSRGSKRSRHSTGIGLGLYLCRQIITAHGGQIGVISAPGEGSTFWLTLPLAIAARPSLEALDEDANDDR
ncbi:MAG TPA: PAS domain S-box protein [Chroococcidiopsis sp.]